jgi:hypothetical protein
MADRTYDLLIDTPENRKIAETLRRYNNIKNTNGQPNYLWKVPHISGQPSLKGGSCCSECKMTGGAMPNSVLLQMDERQALQRPRGMVSPYTQPPDKYILSGNRPLYPQFNSVELDALNNRKVGRGWGAVEGYNPDGTKMTKEQYEAYLKKPRPRPMYVRHDGKPVFGRPDIKPRPDVMPNYVMPNPEIVLEGSGAFSALATQGLKQGAKTGAKYAVKGAKLAVAGAKQGAKIAVMVANNPVVREVVSEIAKDKDVQQAVIGQITTMIKGKAAENVVEDAKEEELEGGRIKKGKSPKGKTDGRAKRAEIVKQVMKLHNLKMIEASQYVKKHNLY